MSSILDAQSQWNRRRFLRNSITGSAALSTLLGSDLLGKQLLDATNDTAQVPHFAAKAKRVIYLFQSGGPSQFEMMDYKPKLKELHGTELPDSIRQGQRLTGMTSGQKSFPVVAPRIAAERLAEGAAFSAALVSS